MIDEKKPNIEKLLADEGIFSTGSFHFRFLKAYFLESKQNKKFSTKITNFFIFYLILSHTPRGLIPVSQMGHTIPSNLCHILYL